MGFGPQFCCNLEGRTPHSATISADGGLVGNPPYLLYLGFDVHQFEFHRGRTLARVVRGGQCVVPLL